MSISNFSFKYICVVCYLILRFYCLICSVTNFRDLILKIEMLVLQNKTNIEVIGF